MSDCSAIQQDVHRLVSRGAHDHPQPDGATLLIRCAIVNCGHGIKKLIGTGSTDIEYVDPSGRTALDHAVTGGHLDGVRWLFKTTFRHSHAAAATELALLLLDRSRNVNAVLPRAETLPMLVASVENRGDLVRVLVRRGGDPDRIGGGGRPLNVAAERGACRALRALLEAGADADSVDATGFTALETANHAEQAAAAQLLSGFRPTRPASLLP